MCPALKGKLIVLEDRFNADWRESNQESSEKDLELKALSQA